GRVHDTFRVHLGKISVDQDEIHGFNPESPLHEASLRILTENDREPPGRPISRAARCPQSVEATEIWRNSPAPPSKPAYSPVLFMVKRKRHDPPSGGSRSGIAAAARPAVAGHHV